MKTEPPISGYIGDKYYYILECQWCEGEFLTENDATLFCCKECFNEAKIDEMYEKETVLLCQYGKENYK